MIKLTPDEERLREALIEAARNADPADPGASARTYGEWVADLGLTDNQRATKLTTMLYHVNVHEHERGRPMVGTMAVSKAAGNTGKGFLFMRRDLGLADEPGEDGTGQAAWQHAVAEAVSYWHGQDGHGPDPVADETLATVREIKADLGQIKQMLRTLLHG